jgi:hypothetical protein
MEDGLVYHWSKDRNPIDNVNCVVFQTEPILSLHDETFAWQWDQKAKTVIKMKKDGKMHYYIPHGEKSDLSKQECELYEQEIASLAYTSFDEMFTGMNKLSVAKIDKNNWKLSQCSCSWFAKNYMCCHIIATAVRLKLHEFKEIHMAIPIGQNRKRGRPANTTKALLTQPGETPQQEEADGEQN